MLRNFKVVGTHPSGLFGLNESRKHCDLMNNILDMAYGQQESVSINGQDWETIDGTTESDFIHVVDLAKGYVRVLERLKNDPRFKGWNCFNMGSG